MQAGADMKDKTAEISAIPEAVFEAVSTHLHSGVLMALPKKTPPKERQDERVRN